MEMIGNKAPLQADRPSITSIPNELPSMAAARVGHAGRGPEPATEIA